MTPIREAVVDAAAGLVEKIKPDLDSLSHKALLPVYEQVLSLIDRYSTDPEIDAVVSKVRDLLGIEAPQRPTYTQPDEEEPA